MPHKEQLEFEIRELKRQIAAMQDSVPDVFMHGYHAAIDGMDLDEALTEVLPHVLHNDTWQLSKTR
jgi:hypothetical protein